MRNQTDGTEHSVMTDKWDVPNRMQEITVNRGLGDIEHAHRNESGIVAHTVSLEAPLVFFRFR